MAKLADESQVNKVRLRFFNQIRDLAEKRAPSRDNLCGLIMAALDSAIADFVVLRQIPQTRQNVDELRGEVDEAFVRFLERHRARN